MLARDLLGELEREAVRVVQEKRVLACHRLSERQLLLEQRHAERDGLLEPLLFSGQAPEHEPLMLAQLGVAVAHAGDNRARDGAQKGFVDAQLAREPDGAADYAA